MVHMPIIYFFGKTAAPSPLIFAAKLLAYAVTLLVVSSLLEEKYQVWIKNVLRKLLDKDRVDPIKN
jgi:hypothetical protein